MVKLLSFRIHLNSDNLHTYKNVSYMSFVTGTPRGFTSCTQPKRATRQQTDDLNVTKIYAVSFPNGHSAPLFPTAHSNTAVKTQDVCPNLVYNHDGVPQTSGFV